MVKFTQDKVNEIILRAGSGIELPIVAQEILTHFIVRYLAAYLQKDPKELEKTVSEFKDKLREKGQNPHLVKKIEALIISEINLQKQGAK